MLPLTGGANIIPWVREEPVLMTGNSSVYYLPATFDYLLHWIIYKNARFVQTGVS